MKRALILAVALALASPALASEPAAERMTAVGEMAYTLGACYWRGTPSEQAQVVTNLTGDPGSQTQEEREWRASLVALYEEGKALASKLTAPQCDRLITQAQARVDAATKSP